MVRLLASTLAAFLLIAVSVSAVPLDSHSADGERPDPDMIAALPRGVVHPWSDDPHIQKADPVHYANEGGHRAARTGRNALRRRAKPRQIDGRMVDQVIGGNVASPPSAVDIRAVAGIPNEMPQYQVGAPQTGGDAPGAELLTSGQFGKAVFARAHGRKPLGPEGDPALAALQDIIRRDNEVSKPGKYAALRNMMGKGLGVDDAVAVPVSANWQNAIPAAAAFPLGATTF